MKNILNCSLLVVLLFCLVTPAAADLMVVDMDLTDSFTNPQRLANSGDATEEEWLERLLGLTYDDSSVELISKDEDSDPLDEVPSSWLYAVLKYGVGKPSPDNPDHWAIMDDGDLILELEDIVGVGLPATGRLSHVAYFGSVSVPEPSTILLLGFGLIGIAGIGRRKFKK